MRLIDVHMHVFETMYSFGRNGELRTVGSGKVRTIEGREFQLIPPGLGDRSFEVKTLIDLMDQNRVEKGVLLQGSFYGFQNDYVAESAAAYPNRLLPAGTLDPFCGNAAHLAEVLLGERGMKAMKFEVSSGAGLMSYHPAFALDGDVFEDIFEMRNKRGATLVLDIGSPGMDSFQVPAVARIAERYPSMRIVVCHLLAPHQGDRKYLEESFPLLKKENIWFDCSALPWNVNPEAYPYPTALDYLRLAKETVGADKLMFGTDVPSVLNHSTYAQLVDFVQQEDVFTTEELDGYYWKNALNAYSF